SGPVQYLEEMNIADNHINLVWRPPLDNRGDLDGYDIGFQEVHGLYLGDLQERQPQIDDPFATTAMLPGLLPNTKYRIHIWPRTSAGRGEGFYIERTTTAPG
ncbi:neuroglian, partial [Biomphalaria glabrata]